MQRWEQRARRWQISAEQRRLQRTSALRRDDGAANQAGGTPGDQEHPASESSAGNANQSVSEPAVSLAA